MVPEPVPLLPEHHHVETNQDDALGAHQIGKIDCLISRVVAAVNHALLAAKTWLGNALYLRDAPLRRVHGLSMPIVPLFPLRPQPALKVSENIGDVILPPSVVTGVEMMRRGQTVAVVNCYRFNRGDKLLSILGGAARPARDYPNRSFFFTSSGTGLTFSSNSAATPSLRISDLAGSGGSISSPGVGMLYPCPTNL